jgi:CHRD domain-containing protein
MRTKLFLIGALAAIAALALPTFVPAAGQGVRKLEAALDGAAEVPDKGDPNASGLALVTVKVEKRKTCFNITFEKLDTPPFVGHIHRGKEGVVGPPVVTLFEDPAGVTSPVKGCVRTGKKLLRKIKENPERYYVNLHNDEYPEGAIRGQLVERG